MSSGDFDSWLSSGLRAMRERDRAQAPTFEQVLNRKPAVSLPRRKLKRTWASAVVIAALVAVLVVLSSFDAPSPAAVTWSEWRSPTAILLTDADAGLTAEWRKSPSDALMLLVPTR